MSPFLLYSALMVPRADAALVTTTYCFEINVDHTDKATGDFMTGDFTKARGNRVQFVRESDSVTVYDGNVQDGQGANPGCVVMDGTGGTVKLDTSESYTVRLPREASVEGNTILVQNASGNTYVAVPKTGLVPIANHTYSYANGDYWTRLAATDPARILAVAQWSLHRRDAGLTGETFTFRNADCGGSSGSGSCYEFGSELIWIAQPDRKFVVAYILGLAVVHATNNHQTPEVDTAAEVDNCIQGVPANGTLINTREYGSAGAVYGLARFYAAVVFNDDGNDADCAYRVTYEVDWNADGDPDDPDEVQAFSCSGSPAPNQNPPIAEFAYFNDLCFVGGDVNNRGTVYDWLKFWWDFHTDSDFGGHSVTSIFALMSAADPDDWIEAGDLGGGSTDYPYARLLAAEGGGPLGDFNELGGQHGVEH